MAVVMEKPQAPGSEKILIFLPQVIRDGICACKDAPRTAVVLFRTGFNAGFFNRVPDLFSPAHQCW